MPGVTGLIEPSTSQQLLWLDESFVLGNPTQKPKT